MSTTEDCPPFRFIEFNPRRAGRGVEAARVQVDDDGEWLWMSKKDIRNNIRDFGWHPELQRALDAYDGKRTDAAQTSAMEEA